MVLSFLVHLPLVLHNTGENVTLINWISQNWSRCRIWHLGFRFGSWRLRFPLLPSPMPCSSRRDTKMFDSLNTARVLSIGTLLSGPNLSSMFRQIGNLWLMFGIIVITTFQRWKKLWPQSSIQNWKIRRPVSHERNPTSQDVRGLLSAWRHWPEHWLAAVRALYLSRGYWCFSGSLFMYKWYGQCLLAACLVLEDTGHFTG